MTMKIAVDTRKLVSMVERFPEQLQQVTRQGLQESCRVIQRRARRVHKFKSRTGNLERAVQYEVHTPEAIIRVADETAPYGKYVHTGTGKYGPKKRPYDIFPKNKKRLRFATSPGTATFRGAPYDRFHEGGFTYAKGVTHPGIHPDPFLYEAGEASEKQINAIFERRIDELGRRLGG